MRAALSSLLLLVVLPASAATVTVIDVPGGLGTFATAISRSDIIAGSYTPSASDPCGEVCGFFRMPDGTYHNFSVFGANVVEVDAVLDDLTSVGGYIKGHNIRGFIRTPDGTSSDIFLHRSSVTMTGVNSMGIAVGSARGSGFMRTPDGVIKIMKPKGCTDFGAVGIANAGTIAGNCFRGIADTFGYLRAPDGSYKLIKHRGWENIDVRAMDHTGAVTGFYNDENLGSQRIYVRDADGTFHTFAVPGDNPVNTYIIAMNLVGSDRQVVGWLSAGDQRNYGFIVHGNGTSEVFDVSGGHASQTGTVVSGISPSGTVIGDYTGDDGKGHAYMRTP